MILLSQIRGSIVVLRDRIHKELGHTIDYRNQDYARQTVYKAVNEWKKGEQSSCSIGWLRL